MKLRKERRNFESCGDDAFAEISYGFSDDTDPAFVFRRKKKRPQERTVDTVAESQLRIAQTPEKFG